MLCILNFSMSATYPARLILVELITIFKQDTQQQTTTDAHLQTNNIWWNTNCEVTH